MVALIDTGIDAKHLATESLEEYFDAVVDRNTEDEALLAGSPKKDADVRELQLFEKKE